MLDSGWFFDPAFQWGHSSSPIIYRNSVILQADVQKGSYLAAWDLATGKQLWKTPRPDEISTWGTPTIARTRRGRDELVTNGTKVRGYDPATGKLLWTLGPNSEITIGTPVAGNGLVFVTGGYPPVRPIYAIRPGAEGRHLTAEGAGFERGDRLEQHDRGHLYPDAARLRRTTCSRSTSTASCRAYDPETGQRAFRGRVGIGRLVLGVTRRRRRPAVRRERGRRSLCPHRGGRTGARSRRTT